MEKNCTIGFWIKFKKRDLFKEKRPMVSRVKYSKRIKTAPTHASVVVLLNPRWIKNLYLSAWILESADFAEEPPDDQRARRWFSARPCGTLRARQDTKEIVDVHYIRLCLKPSRPCSSTNCENLPHWNLSHHTSHSAIINLAPSIRTTSAVATGERRTGRCGHTGSRRRNPARRRSRLLVPP